VHPQWKAETGAPIRIDHPGRPLPPPSGFQQRRLVPPWPLPIQPVPLDVRENAAEIDTKYIAATWPARQHTRSTRSTSSSSAPSPLGHRFHASPPSPAGARKTQRPWGAPFSLTPGRPHPRSQPRRNGQCPAALARSLQRRKASGYLSQRNLHRLKLPASCHDGKPFSHTRLHRFGLPFLSPQPLCNAPSAALAVTNHHGETQRPPWRFWLLLSVMAAPPGTWSCSPAPPVEVGS